MSRLTGAALDGAAGERRPFSVHRNRRGVGVSVLLTKELYFTDANNVRVQLQDVRYRGGIGPLGDRRPR